MAREKLGVSVRGCAVPAGGGRERGAGEPLLFCEGKGSSGPKLGSSEPFACFPSLRSACVLAGFCELR